MLRVEIVVKDQIDKSWSDWLDDLVVSHTSDGNTLLNGTIRDQSALYGPLSKLSSFGLQLISVSSRGINTAERGKEKKM